MKLKKNFSIAISVVVSFVLILLIVVGCNKNAIHPVDVIVPKRMIDSDALDTLKSNIENRRIVIGYLSGWGKSDASILMHTPDLLDIIVLTDGFNNISDAQQADLDEVRSKKKTKVFVSFEMADVSESIPTQQSLDDTISRRQTPIINYHLADWESLNDKPSPPSYSGDYNAYMEAYRAWLDAVDVWEKNREEFLQGVYSLDTMKLIAKNAQIEIIEKALPRIDSSFELVSSVIVDMKSHKFDGMSLHIPDYSSFIYLSDTIGSLYNKYIIDEVGKGTPYYLVIEGGDLSEKDAIVQSANWLVYNRSNPQILLGNYTENANEWKPMKFLPSIDFTDPENGDGFIDSKTFSSSGIVSRPLDIVNWESPNKAGVAYYHIEEDYNNISGNVTYTTLRQIIEKVFSK